MPVASRKHVSRSAALAATTVARSAAAHATQPDAVWMSNGRLVSHTIVEPGFKRELEERMAALRSDLTVLKARYVKLGVLTKGGKLTSRYGG